MCFLRRACAHGRPRARVICRSPGRALTRCSLSRTAVYSFDDVSGDTALTSFNINKAPSYLFSVLNDIRSINDILRIHILPWSPVSLNDM